MNAACSAPRGNRTGTGTSTGTGMRGGMRQWHRVRGTPAPDSLSPGRRAARVSATPYCILVSMWVPVPVPQCRCQCTASVALRSALPVLQIVVAPALSRDAWVSKLECCLASRSAPASWRPHSARRVDKRSRRRQSSPPPRTWRTCSLIMIMKMNYD